MKTVLITGAGSGLGAALAKAYIKKAYHVILVGRRLAKLESLAKDIDNKGSLTSCFSLDISDVEAIKIFRKEVKKTYTNIDILINCAGVGYFGPLNELAKNDLEMMFKVNTFGTIYMTQQFIDITTDRIINIISTAGLKGKVNESAYVASKFAVRGFTESIQKEYEDRALIITAVYMGGMATPFWEGSTHIKDMSRLKSPELIAEKIISSDGRLEEIVL